MERLIASCHRFVFAIVYRLVCNLETAKDLSQDTWVKAFLSIRSLREPDKFMSWIGMIARRTAQDYLRREGRKQAGSAIREEGVSTPEPQAGIRRRIILENAMAKLPERDRMILALAYHKGLNLAEIGGILKLPESHVKTYIHRARIRLRKKLEGREEELLGK